MLEFIKFYNQIKRKYNFIQIRMYWNQEVVNKKVFIKEAISDCKEGKRAAIQPQNTNLPMYIKLIYSWYLSKKVIASCLDVEANVEIYRHDGQTDGHYQYIRQSTELIMQSGQNPRNIEKNKYSH